MNEAVFKDRKHQRHTIEIMDDLLDTIRKHADEETVQAIDTTLLILTHTPTEYEVGDDGK